MWSCRVEDAVPFGVNLGAERWFSWRLHPTTDTNVTSRRRAMRCGVTRHRRNGADSGRSRAMRCGVTRHRRRRGRFGPKPRDAVWRHTTSPQWGKLAVQRRGRTPQDPTPEERCENVNYFTVTAAPASSSLVLAASASSFLTPSRTGLGQPSTSSLASFRPREVSSRTTLMTLIF